MANISKDFSRDLKHNDGLTPVMTISVIHCHPFEPSEQMLHKGGG
jgi:predicted MPP superfamily phosphohydrolase